MIAISSIIQTLNNFNLVELFKLLFLVIFIGKFGLNLKQRVIFDYTSFNIFDIAN